MDMATALAELGVTEATLDAETAERLDRDGFAPLPGVLDGTQLEAIRARLAELLAAEGDQAGIEVHQEAGTDRLADLVNKGEMFRPCFTDSRLLACMAHVLGDFKLSSLNFRAPLPGQGHQNLHTDWGGPVEPGDYQVCNAIWLLDDFTASNGATRVVPGSVHAGRGPEWGQDYPEAVPLTCPARRSVFICLVMKKLKFRIEPSECSTPASAGPMPPLGTFVRSGTDPTGSSADST